MIDDWRLQKYQNKTSKIIFLFSETNMSIVMKFRGSALIIPKCNIRQYPKKMKIIVFWDVISCSLVEAY